MVVSLSAETKKLLEEKLKAGPYESVDAVVQAALVALHEVESHGLDAITLAALDKAEDQIDRGEVHAWRDVREGVRDKFLRD